MPKDLFNILVRKYGADNANVLAKHYPTYFVGYSSITHPQFRKNIKQLVSILTRNGELGDIG